MSDSTPASTPKKSSSAAAKSKKPRVKPAHPRTSEMVNAAIKNLKERGGSSLQAIKKYITVNYNVNAEKLAPFIKKYLKSAVTFGSLVQTKGKGASGSFKLAVAGAAPAAEKPEKKKTAKPAGATSKQKRTKPATKKAPATKKSTVTAKKATAAASSPARKPAAAKSKAAKSPSKVKKAAKGPTKKPKAPKPKKTSAPKSKPAAKKSPKKK